MPFTIEDAMPRKKYGETSFGERLQAIRKTRGLTQVQLAEAAETTQRAVSYYETEARRQWKRFHGAIRRTQWASISNTLIICSTNSAPAS